LSSKAWKAAKIKDIFFAFLNGDKTNLIKGIEIYANRNRHKG
jgi:hypothetical protein